MMKKTIYAILAGSLLLQTPALAAEDTDARRAILELRAQMRQSQLARANLQEQIQALQEEIASLRGLLELNQNGEAALNTTNPNHHNDSDEQQNLYDQAMVLYQQGTYLQSVVLFDDFIIKYPHSQLTPNAMFYKGSSLYASKQYADAIKQLNQLVVSYPDNAQAPNALLIISAAQVEQNRIKEAKQTLLRIQTFYPRSEAAKTASDRLKYFK